MPLHPSAGESRQPFHYSGIVAELSETMKHVFQAQDWKERPPVESDLDAAARQERGNLLAALTHLRNAFTAIEDRHADLHYALRMKESAIMEERAPEIARAIRDADVTALPPALGGPPPTSTPE